MIGCEVEDAEMSVAISEEARRIPFNQLRTLNWYQTTGFQHICSDVLK